MLSCRKGGSSKIKSLKFNNLVFQIFDEVYEPAGDSFLLADYLKHEIRSKDIILDLGTGCGIQAILATTLKNDVQVIATDINPIAVKNAVKNARLNNVSERIEFIHGDLFQPFLKKECFSLIIFNFPYLPLPLPDQKKKDLISLAWTQGIGTNNIVHRFLFDCQTYLNDKGRVLMVVSTLS
ncbi:MAG: HemK2/MTQ2 family protein methyltransferase, partial [Promethearchaeota archaeon]